MSLRSLFALVLLCSIYCAVAVSMDMNLPDRHENGIRISVGLLWMVIGYTLALPEVARTMRIVATVVLIAGLLLSFPGAMYFRHYGGWVAMLWFSFFFVGVCTAPILGIAMIVKRRFLSATAIFLAFAITCYWWYQLGHL